VNPSGPATIAGRWETDNAARQGSLMRARQCAALTKPWVLPPDGQTGEEKLPESYQSLGAHGTTNLEGKMLVALFPPDMPWFALDIAADIKHDLKTDPESLQQAETVLFYRSLVIAAALESANLDGDGKGYRNRMGFRTRKRMSLGQLLVTGDTLEYLTNDYRLKTFRRDQYVTFRDSCGDVCYHIVKENIDPLTLTDDQLVTADLKPEELKKKRASERMMDLHTMVEFQPRTKKWTITQELNGHEIASSEEPHTPFFSTCGELSSGEHYGRGFIEQHLGSFRSFDRLGERLLDFAAMASRMHPVLDYACQMRDTEFNKPTGSVLRAKVVGGQVQDVALLKVEKLADFKVVYDTYLNFRGELGKAMLMEDESAPTGEAGRSPKAWQTIVNQLDGALGGLYAPIADDQQLPLLRRTIYQLERDKLLQPLPNDMVSAKVLTGIHALVRQRKAAALVNYAQTVAALGDSVVQKLNPFVIADVLARYQGIDEPGVVKTTEQVMQEQQQAMAKATQAAAAEKAVDLAGNHNNPKPTPPQTRPPP
jgi:hypothetical protein